MENKLEVFSARYCGFCRSIKKHLALIKEEFIDLEINVFDIDAEKQMVKKRKVVEIPTIIYLEDDEEIRRATGGKTLEELRLFLKGEKA